MRDDVIRDVVFNERIFTASQAAEASVEIAGRSPSMVLGAKQLINPISNVGDVEYFVA